jgi:hypothetical protein
LTGLALTGLALTGLALTGLALTGLALTGMALTGLAGRAAGPGIGGMPPRPRLALAGQVPDLARLRVDAPAVPDHRALALVV